ncbi:hypothetical protein [Mycobacterium sp. 1423905.2]|uniref:hypothetical protein n=1 Tax=Mycobacterium sp. 1423905.2 TaxID=1856859 RepID=UPI0007FE17A9|nr:hypothetical protein [Mycobacterium sp. 1423905.2]OBJ58251.1 hypothetical protein A9W95_11940 [Mycobacterium sp. 1423905.2]
MGGLDCAANPFVKLTNPLALQHWTMPLIELTLVAGTTACLVHALRWRRTQADASNLVIWFAGIVCLLFIEPFTYFPQWFGLEKSLGVTFVHNQFTVQFLYDRLPLYIVAMYPFFGYAAWVLVQRTGILRRYNSFVGAACVAFAFLALYEVIDMVGPQFRWWVWNENLSTSVPTLSGVPYLNLQSFSVALPFAMAFVTLRCCKPGQVRAVTVARNVLLVSILVWPILFLSSLPWFFLTKVGVSVETARIVGTWLLVSIIGVVTAIAFVRAYKLRRGDPAQVPPGSSRDYFVAGLVTAYLLVSAVCWIAALPDYFHAKDGFTATGARVGSLPFALAMAAVAIALTVGAYLRTTRCEEGRHVDATLVLGPPHRGPLR